VPVSVDRDRALDTSLWRPSHSRCNRGRGNGEPMLDLGSPSRDW
jgi:hypothetical protein